MSFWDRNKGWLLFVGVLLLVMLVTKVAKGQCPGDYGCAQFYRTDAWPREGLVEHWVMDPGVRGDSMAGAGDFESWTGTEGGCTDCPESWICDCTTYGGDVDQSTTYLYRSDTSLVMDPAGAFSCLTSYIMTLTQFETYQIRFCYRGGGGTEDLLFGVGNSTMTDTYDFSNDVFSGALTMEAFANVGTTWTCASYYLYVGATTKTAYYVAFATQTGDGTAIYIDDVKVSRLYDRNVTGMMSNTLSVDTGSDQQWGRSEVMLPRTGTGPAYKTGMKTDGVDDHLYCDDGDCEMDPVNWNSGGKFSVGCRVTTDTVAAGTDYIITKWAGGGNQSWILQRNTANLGFLVSDDGANSDSNAVTVFTANALHGFVSTFDPSGGSGACVNNLYYDAYQVDTDATMTECGPFDSAAELQVGAVSGGGTWDGFILECSLWEGVLSTVDANKYISPYFPGTDYNDGFYVDTCSQAANHATCSTQVCRDGTPNACQAEGTGVMACYGGYTEQTDNNSFEAYTGDPSDGEFSDWTEGGNVTAYLADSKHGNVSLRMQGGSMTSECFTVGQGADLYVELSAKELDGGGGTIEVWLREYDTGFCTTQLALTTIITCTPGGVYDDCGALIEAATWNASTSSYKIQIVDSVDGDMLVDCVSVKAASYRTPWVHCPTGSGSVTYSARQYDLFNPLSSYCESEDGYCYVSGFCASVWFYTDWNGDDGVAHGIFRIPPTVGDQNRVELQKASTDRIYFELFDAAGATRNVYLAVNSTNWTGGDWKFIETCSNNSDDTVKARWYNVSNSTWYDLANAGGVGTGIQADQNAEIMIGYRGGAGQYLDGYISEIHVGPYSAIYPMKGFNGGRPPVNGSPY